MAEASGAGVTASRAVTDPPCGWQRVGANVSSRRRRRLDASRSPERQPKPKQPPARLRREYTHLILGLWKAGSAGP